ncbi:DUF814 domain-containing protein [Candidatus Woesearchaeota archaeon]|nr:DUF814 domain-containing protein [Candidatus Woesearchaeota archaeon]
MRITLKLNKSLQENANAYFEAAKKNRKKLKGALKAHEKVKAKTIEEKESHKGQQLLSQQSLKVKRKEKWFEEYHWCLTTSGKLMVGGRDATTNETVIKKHAEKGDLVFHTDMAGSPFIVLKFDKSLGEFDDRDKEEAAMLCAAHSKAWKSGMGGLDVFYVNPDQVSKKANPGEYLQKGAFMIRGQTNYLHPRLDYAVGIIAEGEHRGMVMGGPSGPIGKHCKKFVRVGVGKSKTSEAAKLIKKKVGGEIDDIIRVLPAGGVDVRK